MSDATITLNVDLLPFGQASIETGFAHPERFPQTASTPTVTPVMPLTSSVITPGHSRPTSV